MIAHGHIEFLFKDEPNIVASAPLSVLCSLCPVVILFILMGALSIFASSREPAGTSLDGTLFAQHEGALGVSPTPGASPRGVALLVQ